MKTLKKVFIVEDSKDLEEWLEDGLNALEGISVAGTANSYSGAVESIMSIKPDIVIIDIKLEEGNGIDVLKKIKQEGLPVKTIVFTNYPMFRKQCIELGADYFLDKSFDYDKIISLVGDLEIIEG